VCVTLPYDKPKIVLGDFNAKIRKESIYKPTIGSESLHDLMNDNGNKLITFATSREYTQTNMYFPMWASKKPNRSYDSRQPDKIMRQ